MLLDFFFKSLTFKVEVKGQSLTWAPWHGLLVATTKEADVGESHFEGLPGLQSEVKASLGNLVRLCLKMKKTCRGLGM